MLLSIPQNRITLSLNRRLSLQKIFCQPIELAKYSTRTLSWGQSSVMDKHLKYLRMITSYGGSTVTMQGLQELEKARWDCSSMLGASELYAHPSTQRLIRSVGFEPSSFQTTMTLPYGKTPNPWPHMDYAELERRILADEKERGITIC